MEFQTPPQLVLTTKKNQFATTFEERVVVVSQSFAANDMQYRSWLRYLAAFEILGAILFGIGAFALGILTLSTSATVTTYTVTLWKQILPQTFYFWIGILCWLFAWYRGRTMVYRQPVLQKQSVKQIDLWHHMTPELRVVIERSVQLARREQQPAVLPVHLFLALLKNNRIRNMCIRLSLPVSAIEDSLSRALAESAGSSVKEPIQTDTWQASILYTYQITTDAHLPVIDVTELFLSVVMHDEAIQELLYDCEVEYQKIENMLLWLRTQAEIRRRQSKQAIGASHRSKHGMDRAMTAVATPLLNSLSHDITMDVAYGHTEPCVAREKEITDILQTIESGRPNIMLIGERGVGKRAIIEGIAARMVAGDVPPALYDKRLVELSTSSLVAGTTIAGAQERLLRVIYEVRRSRNIILFIDNVHDLMSTGDVGLDLTETLAELASVGDFILFSTTTPEAYTQQIARSALGSILADTDVRMMDDNQAIQVLESKAPYIEYKNKVFFSYQAIETAVTLSRKFVQQHVLPESAIGIMREAGSIVRGARGDHALVTAEDVATVISNKTGIPLTAISDDESTKLMRLEEAMHERVVGQHEAVQLVASALRRARAAIRSSNRPIANFLFLGPTGVGKTELAKTIAEVYFGGENMMIRLDMSEYQDAQAIYRLIGQPGQQGTGILTEAVRKQPFSLILLDEMEKADPHILNIFLQVFDDGRLTDSVGRTVDFTNSIIIATSNAGTSYVQEQLVAGVSYEEIQQALLHGKLQEYYRPEFLNRFDGIVLFRSLTQTDIQAVAARMLKRIGRDLESRGISLDVTEAAIHDLATIGFDPEFGARPMRRAIQDTVENGIAELLLQRQAQRRDTIRIEEGLVLRVLPPG